LWPVKITSPASNMCLKCITASDIELLFFVGAIYLLCRDHFLRRLLVVARCLVCFCKTPPMAVVEASCHVHVSISVRVSRHVGERQTGLTLERLAECRCPVDDPRPFGTTAGEEGVLGRLCCGCRQKSAVEVQHPQELRKLADCLLLRTMLEISYSIQRLRAHA
jgi:hypothetical protein